MRLIASELIASSAQDPTNFDADPDPDPGSWKKMDPDPGYFFIY